LHFLYKQTTKLLTRNHSYFTGGFPLAWQRIVALYPLTTRSTVGAPVIVGGSAQAAATICYVLYTLQSVLNERMNE